MNRQSELTYGSGATDGHIDGFWFYGNTTSNPTIYSSNIASVTRFTSDGAVELFRVRFREPYPFPNDRAIGEVWGCTELTGAQFLDADRVSGELLSTVGVEAGMEIDIRVITRPNVVSNNVPTNVKITGLVFFDARI